MTVLLDSCVSRQAKLALLTAGIDVVWTGDLDEDPGDEEILEQARREERVLVTLDKDFGELAIVQGKQHRGIIRLVDIRSRRQGALLLDIAAKHAEELAAGAIITAEPGRLRIRPADRQET